MRIPAATADFLGISASLLCAVHCLITPVLLYFFSWGVLHQVGSSWLDQIILAGCVILAMTSLLPSHYRHRKLTPIFSALSGFGVLMCGEFFAEGVWQWVMACAGAALVALAHLFNLKAGRRQSVATPRVK